MQEEKGRHLRKMWGDRPCEHPDWEKEYILGSDTGDYICTQCGKVISAQQRKEL